MKNSLRPVQLDGLKPSSLLTCQSATGGSSHETRRLKAVEFLRSPGGLDETEAFAAETV